MSAQLILEARLRGRDDGLVGQLNATERSGKGAASGLNELSAASRQASSATSAAATSDRAAAAAARDLERARREQERAARAAARAEQQAANEVARALSRRQTGQMQIGQQFQDFFIQVDGGTPILRAFSQQASQLTGALTLLGGEVNGNASRLAKFASFMAGPWGIALGVAIPLVSMLGMKLLENADAAQAAEAGANGLAAAQSALGEVFDLVSGKLKTQNELLILNARLQAINLRAEAAAERSKADSALRPQGLRLSTGGYVAGVLGLDVSGSTSRGAQVDEVAAAVRAAKALTDEKARRSALDAALRRAEKLDFSGLDINKQDFLQAIIFSASAPAKDAIASQIDLSLDSGVLSSVFRRDGPKKRSGSGAAAARALENFGDGASEKIARIADAYNPAPQGFDKAFTDLRTLDRLIEDLGKRKPPSFEKLIGEAKGARSVVLAGIAEPLDAIQQRLVPLPEGVVKAQVAVKELDGVIAVLSERKPPNWQELVTRAEQLKEVASDTVNGPLNDMLRASEEQRAQQLLILQGRDREAAVLAIIQQRQRDMGPLNEAQIRQIENMVASEERINDLLQKRQDILSIYSASIGDLRGALEDLFATGDGGGFLKNTESLIKQFRSRLAVESIFGDSLRALEKKIRGKTPLDREIEDLARQVDGLEGEAGRSSAALKLFTDALATATADIKGVSRTAPHKLGDGSFLNVLGGGAGSADEIVVTASRPPSIGGTLMREQTDFIRELARAQYEPLAKIFDQYLGTDFFRKLSPVFEGAYAGFFTAGPVGGILGAVKELPGLPKKLQETLGGAFEGAQTGTIVAGVSKMLGLKTSTTGAQVGGAIGAATGIPGGDIIGSFLGGLVGGLFKKTPKGYSVITSAEEGGFNVSGNKAGVRQNLTTASSSVQDSLNQVAQALDAQLGSFRVSIGEYKGWYRVSASGSSSVGDKKYPKRAGSDLLYDGQDPEAAVRAALANAIADGAIKGISAAMQQALRSSPDIDKAVTEALKVREVEELLEGLGGTLERQFKEFEAQAKERVRIATQYGFDVNKIEQRNAEDRAKLVDQILTARVGSLQQLLQDLKFGDLFEGSAADRRDKLLTEIAAAKTQAEQGVDGAADRLADLERQLVQTSREAYGTAGSEYGTDRSNAISAAEQIIAAENERIKAAQQATLDTSKAMQTQNALTNETNDILAEMRAIMRANGVTGGGGVLSSAANLGRSVDLR